MELTTHEYTQTYSMLMMFADAMATVVLGIYFWFIKDSSYVLIG